MVPREDGLRVDIPDAAAGDEHSFALLRVGESFACRETLTFLFFVRFDGLRTDFDNFVSDVKDHALVLVLQLRLSDLSTEISS